MPVSIRVGDRLGSYRIVRSIGEGGMGVVYEAVHEQIGRRAAAKVLSLDARQHPGLFQRFINEARAATQIDHPGVVQVFEFGQLPDGTPWMLMEFIQGTTLSAYLRAARKATGAPLGTDGLWILHDLAAILARAHSKGIVHRDLKPSNAMIVEEHGHGERVKLLDFGIAKFLSDSLGEESANKHRTRTGALLGTPAYMAPEQCKTLASIDGQADVYALGVMLYELYTAKQPFFDAEPLALMMQKITEPAPPLRELAPQAPEEIAGLTEAMLKLEPRQRPTMADVQRQLAAFLRLPAARRSGFVPQVTPPERRPEPEPKGPPEPSLPSTQSGPLAPPDQGAAPEEPSPGSARSAGANLTPPMPTGAALIPPTPPEYSSGQLARQAVSLGQQPTRQQKTGSRWLRWSLAAVAGSSLSLTALILLWPARVPRPSLVGARPDQGPTRAAATQDLAAPVDLGTSLSVDLGAAVVSPPMDMSPAEPKKHTPHLGAAKTPFAARACTIPKEGCIDGSGVTEEARQRIAQALADARVKLCAGERLVIDVRDNNPILLEVPPRLGDADHRDLRSALRGRLLNARFTMKAEVRCRR